ncbi:MAG: isoprenylcysteine carboxylmethyltransferase family protein [Chloroflexi bacterium]|nr:isoprenylcysteine carboxylmethyltransferase family protein [Chloroflexota bacterium]
MITTDENRGLDSWKLWASAGLRFLVFVGGMAGLLFVSAGRVDWVAAWLFVVLFGFYLVVLMIWFVTRAPDLLRERLRIASNVKPWDKFITVLYGIFMIALLVTAGLDAGRWGWSAMPLALQWIGVLGLILAGGMVWWTLAENRYAARWARIQRDRKQSVITSGPYRYVRHPMYAAVIGLFISIALALSSWWALLPAGCIGVIFVVRTALEDRMLHQELAGYQEYARHVRYRLIPGIW